VRRAVAACLAVWACGAVAEGDRVTLVLANRADYLEAKLEDRVLAPYVAVNRGVRVVQQSTATHQAEYRERLLTSMAAGSPPDVFLLDDSDVPALVNRGVVLDLAPYLARAGVDIGCLDQTVLSVFSRGNAVYALPRGYTPLVVVYNKDLFDRAGIPYPRDDWTWDDFLRAAKRLTRDTDGDGRIDQWGAYFDRRPSIWIPWVWAGGGDVLCVDGRRAGGCLDAPVTIEAIRWYTGWMTRQGIAPRTHNLVKSVGEDFRLFTSGRVAMLTTGHSWVPRLRPYAASGRLRVGFVGIPHRAGVRPVTVIYASGYAVPAIAARRKLSIELAADLTDSLADGARGEAGLELPALTTAAQALVARDTLGWEAAFVRAAAVGRMPWGARIERWREVEAVLPDLLDRITLAGAAPAAAAHELARQLDRVLGAIR